jgi:hypothetical protein
MRKLYEYLQFLKLQKKIVSAGTIFRNMVYITLN